MSPELRKFLQEWLAWAEADAPPHTVLCPTRGLCLNSRIYASDTSVLHELEDLLHDTTGNARFPFDEYTSHHIRDGDKGVLHRNPRRLAWVREQLS